MSTPSATALTGRRGLMRWTVAAVATAALVVSGSGLVAFAQSGAGESRGPQFVTADATVYVEARLDMPAGQDEALAQFMTAFPLFADPGSFDMKIDELVAGLGSQIGVAMPEGDLIGDVLTGEVGLALSDLESAMMGGEPTMIAGAALADAEAAAAVFDALVADATGEMSETVYNDVAIVSDSASSPPMSMALYGDWMLLGTGAGVVEGAIDVLDGSAPGLADEADFSAAWSRLPSARLAGAYMDLTPFASIADLAGMMAEGQTGVALPTQDFVGMLPTELVASIAAENDRVTLEAFVTPGEQTPDLPVGESELAMLFPSDTQVYVETRELGATVESGLTQIAEILAEQEMAATDEGMGGVGEMAMLFGEESPITAMLGVPLPEFLDFVADAGVGAGLSSDGLWLGIAAEVIDADSASERVTSLLTIMRMGLMQEEGMDITTSEVDGVEVTTLNLPMDAMMAESGMPLSIGDSVSLALTDDTLLIGLGDFVESAILSDGSDSLGASDGYVDALGEDTVNSGVAYVNIGPLLTALDPMLSMMTPEWSQIAPYATGLDRLIALGTSDDEVLRARMTIIVSQ